MRWGLALSSECEHEGVWEFICRPSKDKQRSSDDKGTRRFAEELARRRKNSVGLEHPLKGLATADVVSNPVMLIIRAWREGERPFCCHNLYVEMNSVDRSRGCFDQLEGPLTPIGTQWDRLIAERASNDIGAQIAKIIPDTNGEWYTKRNDTRKAGS